MKSSWHDDITTLLGDMNINMDMDVMSTNTNHHIFQIVLFYNHHQQETAQQNAKNLSLIVRQP